MKQKLHSRESHFSEYILSKEPQLVLVLPSHKRGTSFSPKQEEEKNRYNGEVRARGARDETFNKWQSRYEV